MRAALLALALLALPAGAVTIELTPAQVQSVISQAGAPTAQPSVSPVATPPVVTPPAPISSSTCPLGSVNLGDIAIGGSTRDSKGVQGTVVAYGRIVIPNPLPVGWAGRTTQMSVFEHGDGTAWKRLYLSRAPCDFSAARPAISDGLTASVYLTFGPGTPYAVGVKAGEVWYATIANRLPNGASSCAAGSACNFGYLLPGPGM